MNGEVPLVVFDLGGVVVRICRSWAEGCRAAGLPVRFDESGADRTLMTGEAVARRRAVHAEYQQGLIDCDAFFVRLSAAVGGLYTPEEVRRIHDAWILGEYPGVGGFIGSLKAAGVPTAVLSNTNHSHWERLTAMPVLGAIDHPHASHLLGLAKPDVAIYTEFRKRVGAAGWSGPSERIYFFDDLAENVEAALGLGWSAVQIDHTGDTAEQMRRALSGSGVL